MIIVIYFEQRNNCWSKTAGLIMDKKIHKIKVKFIDRFQSIGFYSNNKPKQRTIIHIHGYSL